MKAYISKYALTLGIYIVDAESTHDSSMIVVRPDGAPNQYFHNQEWHASFEEAKKRAEDMRDRKIVSLIKSLEAMRALKFED